VRVFPFYIVFSQTGSGTIRRKEKVGASSRTEPAGRLKDKRADQRLEKRGGPKAVETITKIKKSEGKVEYKTKVGHLEWFYMGRGGNQRRNRRVGPVLDRLQLSC